MKLADIIVTAPDYTKSIKAGAAHYDEEALAVETYILEGQARALSLGTRDPIRCNDDGALHQDIIEAYSTYGFDVFENVICEHAMIDSHADMEEVRLRVPIQPGRRSTGTGAGTGGGLQGCGLVVERVAE